MRRRVVVPGRIECIPIGRTPYLMIEKPLRHEQQRDNRQGTAGAGDGNYDEILRYTDLALCDIKNTTEDSFRELCGGSLRRTTEFLRACETHGVRIWIRHVVVPGITDGRGHLEELKRFISNFKRVEKVELLPYHTLGVHKYAAMGRKYELENVPPMDAKLCGQLQKEIFDGELTK